MGRAMSCIHVVSHTSCQMSDKRKHQLWLHRRLPHCCWINRAACQLCMGAWRTDSFFIPKADTPPEMWNLISFSPPHPTYTHFIIHSSTSVILVLPHSYHFSLSPPSSIKPLLSSASLKYSKLGAVGIDIFCSFKQSAPLSVVFFID